jgi:hypothetical protein
LIQAVTDDHHRHDNSRNNHRGKGPEDDVTPFDANPITMPAVAATVNLAIQNIQDKAFPEFPAASFDVIRLTAWALHGQGSSRRSRTAQSNPEMRAKQLNINVYFITVFADVPAWRRVPSVSRKPRRLMR